MGVYRTFDLEKRDGGTILWFNRPDTRNVISSGVIDELIDYFTQPAKDNQFAVLAGRGDCFVAGADLKEMVDVSELRALEISRSLHRLLKYIGDYQAPVVAAVHGYAIGGGFELALAADMVFATSDAWFSLPELGFSLIPGGGGTQRLTQRLGRADAFYRIFSGENLTAQQCLSRGIVQKLFDDDQFIDTVIRDLVKVLGKHGKAASVALKQAIRLAGKDEGYDIESKEFARLLTSRARPLIKEFFEANKKKDN